MEAMSAGSGQTFSYVNKAQNVANYRCINTIDDRTRWATMTQTLPVNANYNYYVVSIIIIIMNQDCYQTLFSRFK